jgi:hypothetical protein
MEPSIQVGEVTAVYVTVTNLRPVDVMPGQNQVIVLQAHAVAQSGGQVDRLDVDHAIEKAGGADKLLAALSDRSFEIVAPEPSAATFILAAPVLVPWVAISLFVVAAAAPVALPIMYATGFFSDKQKITDKEFPVGRYGEANVPLIGLGGPQAIFIGPQESWKGYVFFPRGSYSTLELTAGAIDDWAERGETIRQIDQGESLTVRNTETIRCPWRQG